MARRAWWYAAGAALLLLAVALVTEWQQRQKPYKTPASTLTGASTLGRRTAATARIPPSDAPNSSARETPSTTGTYEVCGFGKAPVQISTSDALYDYVATLTQKTGDRWQAALLDSSDLRARAMGLLVRQSESRLQRIRRNDE